MLVVQVRNAGVGRPGYEVGRPGYEVGRPGYEVGRPGYEATHMYVNCKYIVPACSLVSLLIFVAAAQKVAINSPVHFGISAISPTPLKKVPY